MSYCQLKMILPASGGDMFRAKGTGIDASGLVIQLAVKIHRTTTV